jgi:hypothetical protein
MRASPAARRRFLLAAPVILGLGLAMAACGGDSPNAAVASLGTTTTTLSPTATGTAAGTSGHASTGKATTAQEVDKFAHCMRAHGVAKFPEPVPGEHITITKKTLVSTPHFQSASRACAKYAPQQAPAPDLTPQDRTDYLKAAACMRSHGIVGFPDPTFTGAQVTFPIPSSMDPKSPQFVRARATCELLIPAGLPYSKEDYTG